MLATNLTTPFRKRQRRHARLPVAIVHERHPARLIVLPAPGGVLAAPAPEVLTDQLPGRDDLDAATWQDAEWQ